MSQLRDLARRFPSSVIHTNPSGGGVYVPHHLYVQRLLMHLGGYSFERVDILRGRVTGKPPNPNGSSQRAKDGTPDLEDAVVGVVCRLTVEVDGRTMVIEDVGDCESPHNWPHDGARLKDAMSDALKRCCARIGLGTHLYSKTEDDYVLYRVLTDLEQFEAGPSGGGEPSGQTLVAGNPAGESKDLTVPANLSPAPSELSGAGDVTVSNGGTDTASRGGDVGNPAPEPDDLCDACVAGDCQHCQEDEHFCECPHDEGRPF